MNQFIKNIKSSAAKYRTQLLVLALAFVSACSPVKEEKVRELIEKDLPPFVKIAELKLGPPTIPVIKSLIGAKTARCIL